MRGRAAMERERERREGRENEIGATSTTIIMGTMREDGVTTTMAGTMMNNTLLNCNTKANPTFQGYHAN